MTDDPIELLKEVYNTYGPMGWPRSGAPEPVAAWAVDRTPAEVYAKLTTEEVDRSWDFEGRHLMHRIAKAISTTVEHQDIKTAPKDGTRVLAWKSPDDDHPEIVEWTSHRPDGGWYNGDYTYKDGDFTHWMPLPPPPNPS